MKTQTSIQASIQSRQTKAIALVAGGVLMASALSIAPTPAHAVSKEKAYKYGAVGLGALGAYYLYKGKTVPGAIAAGAGYYAYKKGQKENDRNDNNGYYYGNGNYGNGNGSYGNYGNRNRNNNGTAYPNSRYFGNDADISSASSRYDTRNDNASGTTYSNGQSVQYPDSVSSEDNSYNDSYARNDNGGSIVLK